MVYMGRVRGVGKAAAVVALLAIGAKVAWDVVTLPDAGRLASGPPPVTALMRQRDAEAAEAGKKARRKQRVVSLQEIAPTAVSSVVISEDAGFFVHEGIDTVEIEAAVARAMEGGKLRGASTITQQLAKNLFLSGERTPVRKAQELMLTFVLESCLSKQRILEIYLNNVEWGEGLFGAQAAARHYFRIDADRLAPMQAARLAVMLPAPKRFEKRPGSAYVSGRAATIVSRMGGIELP